MNYDIERVLFTKEQISEKISELANTLNSVFKGKNPVLVCVLKGSFVFFSDLIRQLDFECHCDFIIARSYGNNAVSSGNLEIIKDLDTDISGRDLILVDDILDTGNTFVQLLHKFGERKPSSVTTVVLLDKLGVRSNDFTTDYKCFDIENEFVVGYGLDYAEKYRNLPYVGVLKKEIYTK